MQRMCTLLINLTPERFPQFSLVTRSVKKPSNCLTYRLRKFLLVEMFDFMKMCFLLPPLSPLFLLSHWLMTQAQSHFSLIPFLIPFLTSRYLPQQFLLLSQIQTPHPHLDHRLHLRLLLSGLPSPFASILADLNRLPHSSLLRRPSLLLFLPLRRPRCRDGHHPRRLPHPLLPHLRPTTLLLLPSSHYPGAPVAPLRHQLDSPISSSTSLNPMFALLNRPPSRQVRLKVLAIHWQIMFLIIATLLHTPLLLLRLVQSVNRHLILRRLLSQNGGMP